MHVQYDQILLHFVKSLQLNLALRCLRSLLIYIALLVLYNSKKSSIVQLSRMKDGRLPKAQETLLMAAAVRL